MNVTADALSSALVHSLWQDAIVGLLLWTVLAALRQRSAGARYVASCAALVVMAALPLVTMLVLSQPAPRAESIATAADALPGGGSATAPVEAVRLEAEAPPVNWMTALRPWALPIWLTGVLMCSLRLVLAGAHTTTLRRCSDPERGAIAAIVSRLAVRMGVGRPVSVRVSLKTAAPATFGFLRPVILLPPASALGITPPQLEAVLAHELAHVRRHDYIVNVLQMLVETLFFYHPAVWWASRRIRVERELCCDDIAVSACGDAMVYAQALTRVARFQVAQSGMAIGSTGGPLLARIQRLVGVAAPGRPVSPLWITTAALALVVAVMFAVPFAQSPTPGTLAPVDAGDGAVVRGRVVDAATGNPIAGASVRAQYITGVENPTRCPIGDCEDVTDPVVGRIPIYRASTDAEGRFEIRGTKPGDYLVAAVASGYVQGYYGQVSDDRPEIPVHVAAGQRTAAIDLRLQPAGSVSGRIFGDSGEGLAGVEVVLVRRAYLPGGSQPVGDAFAQTEEAGVFRFRNVIAGEYYVRAYTSAALRPTRGDEGLSYAATFFPGATDITLAQPLVVGSGEEVAGVDFALTTARKRTVSGRLVDPAGGSLTTATVSMFTRDSAETLKAPADAGGRFHFVNVPPAEYMLTVFDSVATRSWNMAFRDLSVRDDVSDLVLVAGPSVWVDGRVVGDDRRPLPFDPTGLRVSTEQRVGAGRTLAAGSNRVAADGTFSMRSGAGTMSLHVAGLPPRWFVRSVRLDGADVSDAAFELTAGARRRIEIAVSDRVGRLSGRVTDGRARPVPNALVVIFPEERARWSNTRAIHTTFSQPHGGYEIDHIPISSYRVVAVTSLPRNAWWDPEVLARLWPSSMGVSLDGLGQGTVNLRVVPPPADLVQ